jgi:hypothetical protein
MANPLAIALALYGGYKGYKAGKERGGTLGGIVGGALGAAGGFYGGQYLGGKLGMSSVPGTEEIYKYNDETFCRFWRWSTCRSWNGNRINLCWRKFTSNFQKQKL